MASSAIRGVAAVIAHSGIRGTLNTTKIDSAFFRQRIPTGGAKQMRSFSAENVSSGAPIGNWWDRYLNAKVAFVFSGGVLIGINIEFPELDPPNPENIPAKPQAKTEKK